MTKLDDAIEILANEKRSLLDQEKLYLITRIARSLIKDLAQYPRKLKTKYVDSLSWERLDEIYEASAIKFLDMGIDYAVWLEGVLKASWQLFGDPKNMLEYEKQKHLCVPYWNPTTYKVNIHSLGLWTEDRCKNLVTLSFVDPGDSVLIPYPLVLGGKHSVITGVAPQLRPVPIEVDDTLDVLPTSYLEWCSFASAKVVSKCCGKQIVWSTRYLSLQCAKCWKTDSV